MTITLDKFRAKLIIRILYARSAEEAERLTRAAIKAMQKKNINGYIIIRFVDRVINQLRVHKSSKTNNSQWNNILKALPVLQQLKVLISLPVS